MALDHSQQIGAAVGIVMARHHLTREDAWDELRRHSQQHNRKVYDLARHVLETGELPGRRVNAHVLVGETLTDPRPLRGSTVPAKAGRPSVPSAVEPEWSQAATGTGATTPMERTGQVLLGRLDEAKARVEELQRALDRSRDTGAALGILMAYHNASEDQAFQMLLRASRSQNLQCDDLVVRVISRGEVPAPN